MAEVEIVECLPRLALKVEPLGPVDPDELLSAVGKWWRKAMRIVCGGDHYPGSIAVPHLIYPMRKSQAMVVYGGPIQPADYDKLLSSDDPDCTAEVNRALQTGRFRVGPMEVQCSGVVCELHPWEVECSDITPLIAKRKELGPPRVLVI